MLVWIVSQSILCLSCFFCYSQAANIWFLAPSTGYKDELSPIKQPKTQMPIHGGNLSLIVFKILWINKVNLSPVALKLYRRFMWT